MNIIRNVFYCRDCQISIDPLYRVFNIYSGHKVTKGLAEEIAYSAQNSVSFKEAHNIIKRYLDLNISESVITKIAEDIGDKVHQNDIEKAEIIYENYEQHIPNLKDNEKENCNLNIMADGSMLSIKTEEGTCWKENKLGIVFKDNNKLKKLNGKNIITEKEYVSYLGDSETFKKMLFKAAIDNGYGTTKNIVFVADGAKWLWNMCDELFPDAVQILDYYHLSENVYKYANHLFPNDKTKMKNWAKTCLKEIEEGNVDAIIEQLPDDNYNYHLDIPNLKGYLINNKNRINYNEYKEQGYNIGSGSIESANKKVIQQRLKQPGMHWSNKGCQSIASLRTKYCSNQWDEVKNIVDAA